MPSWSDLNFTKCIFFFGGFSGTIFWRIFRNPMPWIPCPGSHARRLASASWRSDSPGADGGGPTRASRIVAVRPTPHAGPLTPGSGALGRRPSFLRQRRRPRGERRERPPTKGSRVCKLLLNEGTRDWMSAFYFLPHLSPKRNVSPILKVFFKNQHKPVEPRRRSTSVTLRFRATVSHALNERYGVQLVSGKSRARRRGGRGGGRGGRTRRSRIIAGTTIPPETSRCFVASTQTG